MSFKLAPRNDSVLSNPVLKKFTLTSETIETERIMIFVTLNFYVPT